MISFQALAGLGLLAVASVPAAGASDPLAPYRWSSRVLAVVAPSAADPRVAAQRKLYTEMGAGARERDLVLVTGLGEGEQAQALRDRLGIGEEEFRAVLIGKDGGEKLNSAEPLGADALFPLIDGMPMRQEEMKRP